MPPTKKIKKYEAKGWAPNPEFAKVLDEGGRKEVSAYINSPQFTEKDYVDALSSMYKNNLDVHGRTWGLSREMKDALMASPFNTPENNDKAIDLVHSAKTMKEDWNKKNPENRVDTDTERDALRGLAENWNISSRKIHELIKDPKYNFVDHVSQTQPMEAVLSNPNIKPEHLYKFLEHHPDHANEVIGHEKADNRLHDMIFDNPEILKDVTSNRIQNYLGSKLVPGTEGQRPRLDISPKRAKQIIESAHDSLGGDALDKTLAAMDPEEKKNLIDRKLGITGGKVNHPDNWGAEEPAPTEDQNWDSWENGPEHDPKFAQKIAKTGHLSDDQAEHIKRHGDFDSKYNLYHNNMVDPKHGAEMFKLWHDNAEDKGYHAEQLQNKYKRDKDDIYTLDDLEPDLIDGEAIDDTARENAEQNYSFSDYIDDHAGEILSDENFETKNENAVEEINDALINDHEWIGEHPNFDKQLDNHHQAVIDASDDNGKTHIDRVPEVTGGKTAKDLGIDHLADEDGMIDQDDIVEHSKENNPEEIDYSNDDDYTINDHPEYDDRYAEAQTENYKNHLKNNPWDYRDDFSDNYYESDEYEQAMAEARREAQEHLAQPHLKQLYVNSHKDDRFIPDHIKPHIPNLAELKASRKKGTGEPEEFTNKHLPKRSHEHAYGEEQHLHELLKDYADANGGSIDIGRMHKLMPNQGDVWKKIFGPKGKLSSGEIQGKIDAIPKTNYDISYGKWGEDQMQNTNKQDEMIFRLDHSDDSIKPLLADPELYNTFKRVQEVSKKSGHPTKDKTIAWARVDTNDPKHWLIDEVQSDFGKTVRDYLKKEGNEEKADHIQKISDYHKDWRENIMNHIIKEAKKHGVEKISTHSPESKASHTGAGKAHSVYQDSYKKVPRKMGFKPAKAIDLPLTEKAREEIFNKNPKESPYLTQSQHKEAWAMHKNYANTYEHLGNMWVENHAGTPLMEKTKAYQLHHENMADQHRTAALAAGVDRDDVSTFPISEPKSHILEDASKHLRENTKFTHDQDAKLNAPKEPEYHGGHTLNLKPNLVKSLQIVSDLIKGELYLYDNYAKMNGVQITSFVNLIKQLRKHADIG